MELLRVGKRLEQAGTGIFIDLWPLVLGFCGRGWFEPSGNGNSDNNNSPTSMDVDDTTSSIQNIDDTSDYDSDDDDDEDDNEHYLDLPVLS